MTITNERLAELCKELSSSQNPPATYLESKDMAQELLALREKDRWLPIESAPKDGTRILACNADQKAEYIIVGYFNGLHFTDGAWPMIPVTHWMPLPPPPEGGG